MKCLVFGSALLAMLAATAGLKPGSVEVATDESQFTVVSYEIVESPSVITFDVTTNGVSVGGEVLSTARGDVHRLVEVGRHAFKLRLDRELPDAVFAAGAFSVSVTAWPVSDPPDYMVVDLVTNDAVRVPAISYYPSVRHLPNGGLANRFYATTKLVMRKIPAAYKRWQMGNVADKNLHDVILTENYYMAIYELTNGQNSFMSGGTDRNETPATSGYNGWRGTDWPNGGHETVGGSMAKFRAYTGLMLDLPTEAQWEFAARAGEYAHTLYNGTDLVVTDNLAPMLDEIAWYGYNSRNANGKCERKPVGLLKPNAYGLYDMLGNVTEYCLDYWRSLPNPSVLEVDPVGPATGSLRTHRGGTYNHQATYCSLVYRRNLNPTYWNDGERGVDGTDTTSVQGVRLVCPAVAVR